MFFNFAPTIVYRDSYPRNPGPIHWMRAGIHVLNLAGEADLRVQAGAFCASPCLHTALLARNRLRASRSWHAGVVLYTYVILRSVLVPLLHEKRSEARGPVMDVVMLVQGAMVPAILVFLLSFFGILHSWLNVWAELLRFADRQFYASWCEVAGGGRRSRVCGAVPSVYTRNRCTLMACRWTATTWSAYYRRWNQVVGDNVSGGRSVLRLTRAVVLCAPCLITICCAAALSCLQLHSYM